MSAIRVLIVDDHEVVRVGLRTLLARFPNIEVVGDAGTVPTALAEIERSLPDIVLLDIRLGEASGFDVCRRIQELPGNIRVLILTSFADNDIVSESISAGADGYLLKEIDGEGLLKAIEKVAAGESVLDPAIAELVLSRVEKVKSNTEAERLESLSNQERRVIALVAEGKTNKEIATAMGLSDKTVKNYFSNILDKLHLSRRSQAAAYFVQHTAHKTIR